MNQAPNRKFLLIDGNSIVYRAFYGSFSLVRAGAKNTNAVYTAIRMLRRVIEKNGPFRAVLFFFDAGKETFRHKENPDYKGKRKKTPTELVSQLPIFKRFLSLLGIAFYEDVRFEADDLLGSAAARLVDSDFDVELLSGDRDLLQLVSPRVSLLLFKNGVSHMQRVSFKNFERLFGFGPEAFLAFKTLVGDSSDNLPGVPGIGPKRALDLIKKFPTIELLFENLERLDKRLAEILESSRDHTFRMLRWTRIVDSAPLTGKLDLAPRKYDFTNPELLSFYDEQRMPSLRNLFRATTKQGAFTFSKPEKKDDSDS